MGLIIAAALAAPRQALMAAGPAPVNLGTTSQFTILAGTTITTTGGGLITGDVGLYPGPGSAQLVPPPQVVGTIYERDATGTAGANVVINAVLLNTAANDLGVAMTDAAGRTPVPTGPNLNPVNGVTGNLAGLNLAPGLYKITTTATIQGTAGSVLPGSVLTLTGGPSDVWIFQCGQDLEVHNDIVLAGGAQAGNVFWQVATDANVFTGVTANGTILAGTSITLYSTSVLNGRALADAQVAFDGASGSLPTPVNPTQGSLEVILTPTNAVTAGALWEVDGGTNEQSGVTLTNLSPGTHVVSFTNIPGWITPSNQTVTIVSGQIATNFGLYTLIGVPPSGGLNVTLQPSNAVVAGAKWRVDGGSNQSSGVTVIGLSPGSHIVSFTTIAGWITPADQTVTITNAEVTDVTGLYALDGTAPSGGLLVTLLPDGAVSGGALWQLDGGSNQTSGLTMNNMAVGSYVVSFTPLFGWITPPNQIVMITNGTITDATGLYSATNAFIAARGVYNGLFSTTNGVTEETAGMLKNLTVGATGIYSGTILINGASYGIRGTFDAEGEASNSIARGASEGGPLTVVMALSIDQPLSQVAGPVSGTLHGAPWVANLIADLATNVVSAAEYTMLLPPDTNNAPPTLSPGGDGYFLITNYIGTVKDPASARVRITGALADGTVFNQSVPVSADGYVPMYASLYGNKGLLLGWINLDLTNTTGVSLTWIHPERASGLYKSGFTNYLSANEIPLSLWADPMAGINSLTNLSMREIINDPIALASYVLTISPSLAFSDVAESPVVSGSINPKTGFFKVVISVKGSAVSGTEGSEGSVMKGNEGILAAGNAGSPLTSFDGTPLAGSDKIVFTSYGAILQNATNGGGYFLTRTNAQASQLNP
jgi:hypothetical protein